MNEVNARRARLVLGWETVFGRVYRLGINIRVRNRGSYNNVANNLHSNKQSLHDAFHTQCRRAVSLIFNWK